MLLIRFVLFIAIASQTGNGSAPLSAAEPFAVHAESHSTPEICAEKDNIQIDFTSPAIRQFRVEADPPAYIGMIGSDRYFPDYTSCDLQPGSEFAAGAQRVTFWETPRFWLVGYRLPEFWRPGVVPIRVGNRTEQGFDIIQLWMRYRERAEEVLVFYPPDGNWRIRPLPFGDLRWTAYGSSILLGPVEISQRPIVAIEDIVFDPDTKTFALKFKRGGTMKVAVTTVSEDRLALEVSAEGLPGDLPFASLRSMYATENNADASRVSWRGPDAPGWSEAPVMNFKSSSVSELWLGRHVASRHNLSAPDIVVGRFAGSPK